MSGFYVSNLHIEPELFAKKCVYLKKRSGASNFASLLGNITFAKSTSLPDSNFEVTHGCTIASDTSICNIASLKNAFPHCNSEEELLVSLYRKYGEKMASYLNGGFSFVIYDSNKRILFGARDRLGKKPLFYYYNNGSFEFSSSLKAICAGKKSLSVNEKARNMYIQNGYILDSACIFEGISKLKAGHCFVYSLDDKRLQITKYWDVDPSFYKNSCSCKDLSDILAYTDFLIKDAIKIRIPQTENFGMGVSAGTDSFSVFCYLNKMGFDPELFTVIAGTSKEFNEYPDALDHVKQISKYKTVNPILISSSRYLEGIKDYFDFYEEPNSDFSCPITNSLFREMNSRSIRKAFSGTGADDIFFGKPIYSTGIGKEKAYKGPSYTPGLEDMCKDIIEVDDYSDILVAGDPMTLQYYDMKVYLPNLLVKEDIAASHYGINIFNPFCDYRLAEFMNTLSMNDIFHGKKFKYLLKQILLKKFKVDFFKAKKKGFFPNLTEVANAPSIKSDINSLLDKDRVNFYFPELSYELLKDKMEKYNEGDNYRNVLNIYFFIKILENYRLNVF